MVSITGSRFDLLPRSLLTGLTMRPYLRPSILVLFSACCYLKYFIIVRHEFQEYVFVLNIEVKIVQQMPTQTKGRKPTVAIITSKYYEKLAVDSMMDDKTTFVRYKTEGLI